MIADEFSAPAAGGQSYVERSPVPALRELASLVWVQQVGREAAPYVHRHVPNGAVELVCGVGSAPRVIGPLTEPVVEVLEPGTTVVGMRFVPGAFPAVAGHPAPEVVGLTLDAEDLWGRSAAALGEAVGTATSPREALTAVQLYVHERARAGEPPDPLVSEAVRGLMPWRTADVTSLSTSLHISETQLRRRCRTAVGLAPLASRAGYADQSHLTRECVRLTGVSPRVFLAETQQTCGCGHDHSASFAPMLRAETGTRPTRIAARADGWR